MPSRIRNPLFMVEPQWLWCVDPRLVNIQRMSRWSTLVWLLSVRPFRVLHISKQGPSKDSHNYHPSRLRKWPGAWAPSAGTHFSPSVSIWNISLGFFIHTPFDSRILTPTHTSTKTHLSTTSNILAKIGWMRLKIVDMLLVDTITDWYPFYNEKQWGKRNWKNLSLTPLSLARNFAVLSLNSSHFGLWQGVTGRKVGHGRCVYDVDDI